MQILLILKGQFRQVLQLFVLSYKKAVSYTYDSSNRLASRTWARLAVPSAESVVTVYSYNSSTGVLSTVDYSDTTPDITYTYNRLGQ